jgi:hypothetical protein
VILKRRHLGKERFLPSDEMDMAVPQKTDHYATGDPRIRIENGWVFVKNAYYTTSALLSETSMEVFQSEEFVILMITCEMIRITCIILEEPARVVRLLGKLSYCKEVREMRQVLPILHKIEPKMQAIVNFCILEPLESSLIRNKSVL